MTADTESLPYPIRRVVMMAKAWACFQQPDSKLDQQTDLSLQLAAEMARECLVAAVEALDG